MAGFYDNEIKELYAKCPRLVILSINSIFGKHHATDAGVISLNGEFQASQDEKKRLMDMLLEIEDCKYHLEFQLQEDNMAIRMYEYAVRETVRDVTALRGEKELPKYVLEVTMPHQAVIFLSGANTEDRIEIQLTVPDGQKVTYELPCVSAVQPLGKLIEKQLFLLVPFQIMRISKKIAGLDDGMDLQGLPQAQREKLHEGRHMVAEMILDSQYQIEVELEKLVEDAIISEREKNYLVKTYKNIEQYLLRDSRQIVEEAKKMGEEGYVRWSDQVENELIAKLLKAGDTPEELAAKLGKPLEEIMAIQKSILVES